MRLIPFGATVGGLSYLSLKGLANTPVVGPYIQVGNWRNLSWYCIQNGRSNISSKLDTKTGFSEVCINVMWWAFLFVCNASDIKHFNGYHNLYNFHKFYTYKLGSNLQQLNSCRVLLAFWHPSILALSTLCTKQFAKLLRIQSAIPQVKMLRTSFRLMVRAE